MQPVQVYYWYHDDIHFRECQLRIYLNSCTLIFGLDINIIDTYSDDVMIICTYTENNSNM